MGVLHWAPGVLNSQIGPHSAPCNLSKLSFKSTCQLQAPVASVLGKLNFILWILLSLQFLGVMFGPVTSILWQI